MTTDLDRFDRTTQAHKLGRDAVRYLDAVVYDLQQVGMDKLAKRVEGPMLDLTAVLKTLRDADSERIAEEFQCSQEASHNILRATLAGLELGRQDTDD